MPKAGAGRDAPIGRRCRDRGRRVSHFGNRARPSRRSLPRFSRACDATLFKFIADRVRPLMRGGRKLGGARDELAADGVVGKLDQGGKRWRNGDRVGGADRFDGLGLARRHQPGGDQGGGVAKRMGAKCMGAKRAVGVIGHRRGSGPGTCPRRARGGMRQSAGAVEPALSRSALSRSAKGRLIQGVALLQRANGNRARPPLPRDARSCAQALYLYKYIDALYRHSAYLFSFASAISQKANPCSIGTTPRATAWPLGSARP